jgi:hypothetical protein
MIRKCSTLEVQETEGRYLNSPASFITRILRYVYVKAHAMSATPLTAIS